MVLKPAITHPTPAFQRFSLSRSGWDLIYISKLPDDAKTGGSWDRPWRAAGGTPDPPSQEQQLSFIPSSNIYGNPLSDIRGSEDSVPRKHTHVLL